MNRKMSGTEINQPSTRQRNPGVQVHKQMGEGEIRFVIIEVCRNLPKRVPESRSSKLIWKFRKPKGRVIKTEVN